MSAQAVRGFGGNWLAVLTGLRPKRAYQKSSSSHGLKPVVTISAIPAGFVFLPTEKSPSGCNLPSLLPGPRLKQSSGLIINGLSYHSILFQIAIANGIERITTAKEVRNRTV